MASFLTSSVGKLFDKRSAHKKTRKERKIAMQAIAFNLSLKVFRNDKRVIRKKQLALHLKNKTCSLQNFYDGIKIVESKSFEILLLRKLKFDVSRFGDRKSLNPYQGQADRTPKPNRAKTLRSIE